MTAPTQSPFIISGVGEIAPPDGLTIEDMESLAREADEARRAAAEQKD